jgi:hypothetical protein
LTLFEAGDHDGAAAALVLLDRASQGAEGPTLLFRAAEIVRPLAGLGAARARMEGISASRDTVPRVYELRAELQVQALGGDALLGELIAEARALAGPACAPALTSLADWAAAVDLARAGSSAAALATAHHATAELERRGERYTAARLMTDLLPVLAQTDAASVAADVAERLEAMGALASAAEVRRYAGGATSAPS